MNRSATNMWLTIGWLRCAEVTKSPPEIVAVIVDFVECTLSFCILACHFAINRHGLLAWFFIFTQKIHLKYENIRCQWMERNETIQTVFFWGIFVVCVCVCVCVFFKSQFCKKEKKRYTCILSRFTAWYCTNVKEETVKIHFFNPNLYYGNIKNL